VLASSYGEKRGEVKIAHLQIKFFELIILTGYLAVVTKKTNENPSEVGPRISLGRRKS
jgi:hypothetical protein